MTESTSCSCKGHGREAERLWQRNVVWWFGDMDDRQLCSRSYTLHTFLSRGRSSRLLQEASYWMSPSPTDLSLNLSFIDL